MIKTAERCRNDASKNFWKNFKQLLSVLCFRRGNMKRIVDVARPLSFDYPQDYPQDLPAYSLQGLPACSLTLRKHAYPSGPNRNWTLCHPLVWLTNWLLVFYQNTDMDKGGKKGTLSHPDISVINWLSTYSQKRRMAEGSVSDGIRLPDVSGSRGARNPGARWHKRDCKAQLHTPT